MMNIHSSRPARWAVAATFVMTASVLLGEGCGSSKKGTNADDLFFVPVQSLQTAIASTPSQTAVNAKPLSTDAKADSLLGRQREQERRIGALSAQVQRLESSRKGAAADSSMEAKGKSSPVNPETKISSGRDEEVTRLYESGQYKAAAEGYRNLLQSGVPADVEDQYNYKLGVCYFNLRQFDLASVALRRIVSRKNSTMKGDAYFILGQTYKQLGVSRQAKTMFEAVLRESPGSGLEAAARAQLQELAAKK
jgi:TolA-binding protein